MEVIEHHTHRPAEAAGPRPPSLAGQFEHLLERRSVSRVIMLSALALTALAWLAARDFAASEARQRFERRCDDVQRRIGNRMASYEAMLRGGAALLAAEPATTRGGWQRYVRTVEPGHYLPGVQAVGVALALAAGEVAPLEQSVRAEGFPDFKVSPNAGTATPRSAVVYIEPLEGRNLRAFGFDMLSEPVRREAMLRARDSGQAALSGVVTLLQETSQDRQSGLLMYLPLFRAAASDARGPHPGRQHWGWVYAAFRVHDLMHGILGDETASIRFDLRDEQRAEAFFTSTETPLGADAGAAGATLQRTLDVGGRHWTVTYADLANTHNADMRSANLVALCGLTMNLLLFWSLSSSMRRRAQAEHQAAARSDEARTRLAWLTAVSGLSPDAILVFARDTADGAGRLVFTNPAFSEWFGLRPEDLEGLSEAAVGEWLDGLAHADDPQPLLAIGEATVRLAGPPVRVLRRGMREDGRQRVYYYRDVTRETEVERLKNEFLTTAAHELRTPLASVYGFSELLVSKRVDGARMDKTVAIIHRQAGVLNHLVNELLDLARIDSRGDADFQRERLDLRHLADGAAETLLRADEPSRIQLRLGEHPLWVRLDATKTRQAVVNVLSNAIKYSAAGTPVTLSLSASRHEGRPGVALVVRDRGIGMSPEQCQRAFERFYRADPSGHILGAGLGLAIVKNLVELQQGQVGLHSTEGEGTTVTLWWPLDDGDDDVQGAPAVPEEAELAQA